MKYQLDISVLTTVFKNVHLCDFSNLKKQIWIY